MSPPGDCILHIFVRRPVVSLTIVSFVCVLAIILPLELGTLPNFTDPTMGFETRGTPIAQRIVTWNNFYEAIGPTGKLTGNPQEYLMIVNATNLQVDNNKRSKSISLQHHAKGRKKKKKVMAKASNKTGSSHVLLQKTLPTNTSNDKLMHMDNYFCGPPDDAYVQFVIKSTKNNDLFNVQSLYKICHMEQQLLGIKIYPSLCLENQNEESRGDCCRAWSLPNYIALLNGRSTCLHLTEEDVDATLELLKGCVDAYHRYFLEESACYYDASECMLVPLECRRYDAVRNILHFLTSSNFLSDKGTDKLEETVVFLPIAKSIATLPLYSALAEAHLLFEGISVVALDFGAKNELFDELLVRDARLMILGGTFVLVCVWLYTGSVFLTVMTIVAIVFSLGLSYFVYVHVFNLEFFPFMNLLAAVVVIGIGADDVFIFCKIWHTMKANSDNTLTQTMQSTLGHALITMFVTSITTAVAFLASYLSSITAIRCFGIFSATAILINYLLIICWLPPSIIIWERYAIVSCRWRSRMQQQQQQQQPPPERWWASLQRACQSDKTKWLQALLICTIIKQKYAFSVVFTAIAVIAAVLVFYHPKLEIQRTNEPLQLFEANHLFEQYDFVYKQKFDFTSVSRIDRAHLRFPLRFLWGIFPVDNGNYLNPKTTGSLVFDGTFNISMPKAQTWLLEFCDSIRKADFYQPAQGGAMLTNCFLETFVSWMNRPCTDPIDESVRYPCCNESSFPYEVAVFELCILDAQRDLHQTPRTYLAPYAAGLRFSKTGEPTIKALVIEYESSLTHLASYETVAQVVEKIESWFSAQLSTAPDSLRNGFFVSDLDFFDLQGALPQNTIYAVAISMTLALVVLIVATWNVVHSLLAIFTITGSILSIMAALVLLGWKLNILESVAVSSTIGFAVDYCLHYTVSCVSLSPMSSEGQQQHRETGAHRTLTRMFGPTLMGALTSGAAGAFMIPSQVLAYKQIGQFLVIVTSVSWLFATFHLGALLAICGAVKAPIPPNTRYRESRTGEASLQLAQAKRNQNSI